MTQIQLTLTHMLVFCVHATFLIGEHFFLRTPICDRGAGWPPRLRHSAKLLLADGGQCKQLQHSFPQGNSITTESTNPEVDKARLKSEGNLKVQLRRHFLSA